MILFLDFDGCLHPTPPHGPDTYLFCRLPLFEAWLRQRPGVDIVISSSWREAHPMDELRGFFAEDLQERVIGKTPVLKKEAWEEYGGESPPTRFERELEVNKWVVDSGEPWRPWVALDDQVWLFRPFNSRLVLCDETVGLTQKELDLIDAAFELQR